MLGCAVPNPSRRRTGCSKTTAFGLVLVCIFFGSLSFLGLLLVLAGGFPGGLAGLYRSPA